MNGEEKQDLASVLASIRDMVRAETQGPQAKVDEPLRRKKKPLFLKRRVETGDTPRKPSAPIPEPKPAAKKTTTAVSKVYILRPHMRVDPPKPEVMDQGAEIPYDTPNTVNESFAIANPEIDAHMLREIVREVVREQLMGEAGRQLIENLKKDVILSLSKNT